MTEKWDPACGCWEIFGILVASPVESWFELSISILLLGVWQILGIMGIMGLEKGTKTRVCSKTNDFST